MKSSNLTKRQLAVLQFIRTFLEEEERSPTLKEIADGVGSSAVSTIHKHVQHLMEKGFLDRSHGAGNNIVVRAWGGCCPFVAMWRRVRPSSPKPEPSPSRCPTPSIGIVTIFSCCGCAGI